MITEFRLSVAIPVHNEESVLPHLLRRLREVLDNLAGGPHERVFVDDGSTDRTFEMLEAAAGRDNRTIELLTLRPRQLRQQGTSGITSVPHRSR